MRPVVSSARPPLTLRTLADDVPAALDLSRAAIVAAFQRSGPTEDAEPRIASVGERIRAREWPNGALAVIEGAPRGIALWDTGHPRGTILQILYLRPPWGRTSTYAEFLDALAGPHGPPVFSPGGLVGLSDPEEETLMAGRGYGRFSRSEMRWPPGRAPPTAPTPTGVTVRPVELADEATVVRLHRSAFEGTFDQYMYLSDDDPQVDAANGVREMLHGHYGEFLGWASTLAELDGRPVGASLVVRAPYGPLLISVMVDRSVQGRGIGRTLVVANLVALHGRGEQVIALNVTEGNASAVRLYEHLGFVRTLGPEHSWYRRAVVPVAPGERATTPSTSPPGST